MTRTASPQQIAFMSHLETLGIPLDGEAVSSLRASPRGIEVCQAGYSQVVDLDGGGTGVEVSVGIDPHSFTTIAQYLLELPWTQVSWLKESSKKDYCYQMPDPLTYPYTRDEVLNHRVGRKGKMFPGNLVEGVLLGISEDPIPAEYVDGQKLRTRLWVFDTRSNSYECRVMLGVSRTKRVKRPEQHRGRRREPLFGRTMDEVRARVQNMSSDTTKV